MGVESQRQEQGDAVLEIAIVVDCVHPDEICLAVGAPVLTHTVISGNTIFGNTISGNTIAGNTIA